MPVMKPSLSERNFIPTSAGCESSDIGWAGVTVGANIEDVMIGGGAVAVVNDQM